MEHLSHFHFFSPCFLRKCFSMPVKSPKAWLGSWWTQFGSGQTYTLLLTCEFGLCFSFQGKLCPLLWSWRFWSLWNPLWHTSQMYLFAAIRVLGDSATTSASGSAKITHKKRWQASWVLELCVHLYSAAVLECVWKTCQPTIFREVEISTWRWLVEIALLRLNTLFTQ